jgi:hypothetical protein
LTVLEIEADSRHETDAQTLTNELRQAVLDAPEHALHSSNPALLILAGRVHCELRSFDRFGPDSDRGIDAACQRRMAARLDVRRLLWGHLYEQNGALFAKVHLYREGASERVATVPYEPSVRARAARRLYAKLVTPERVGEVRVQGDASFAGAELYAGGSALGPFTPGVELTLASGPLELEARREGRVLARAKGAVAAESVTEIRLAFEPSTHLDPSAGFRDPPPVTVTPRPSALPWVFGGVGAAGFGGAAVFFALRRSEQNDLDQVCPENTCPTRRREAGDRAALYGTLSLASLGVGVAGLGLAAYTLLRPTRATPAVGARSFVGLVQPLEGGGFAAIAAGSFLE